ncbi:MULTISPECIES: DUF2285 domain-containing protein [Acetobacteraceae]|uniref:DUF2285 domain-containing protein n=1 Tax=Acetobacter lambici TaxID=1332824 RepID=A0ABT1F207_9PROT|nr:MULTISPECIES: DUF2285 domain-containing protein [Acetobacteraceae]MCP1243158.1 DUF2285 domain-containing protein [Acetobacter lambici]MCP1259240.1 DUF2285 domain-containing protein [Acetobacter lambici]SAY47946.1 hypothetical protein KRIGEM_00891 [Komagataeibacter rhaeticus]GBQ09934.1 hypothetical protein AA16663_0320 [Komagataeibacter rhaeticus DSM 16663]GCD57082.1 hypothetical protein NBRC3222_2419 [Acetobacter pasteurianus NBRC 3222]
MIWRPEVSPATLILTPAPSDFAIVTPINPAVLGTLLARHDAEDDAWLVIGDVAGNLYLRLLSPLAIVRPAVLLPMDDAAELRLDVALRFFRRQRGQRVGLLPRALQLTPLQRARQILLLLAFDIHEAGGTVRDIAIAANRSWQADLPAVEWRNTAARRHAERLLLDARNRVKGGYLDFLRGK